MANFSIYAVLYPIRTGIVRYESALESAQGSTINYNQAYPDIFLRDQQSISYSFKEKHPFMLRRARKKLKKSICSTSLYRSINPRKAHLYCVGTAKSGTNSIAAIFGNQLRSTHEPESNKVIELILDLAADKLGDKKFHRYILARDLRLYLDVDSSQLNFFLVDTLVELFPDAKFVLTIRNPYAWLDSFINQALSHKASNKMIRLRDLRFQPEKFTHL